MAKKKDEMLRESVLQDDKMAMMAGGLGPRLIPKPVFIPNNFGSDEAETSILDDFMDDHFALVDILFKIIAGVRKRKPLTRVLDELRQDRTTSRSMVDAIEKRITREEQQ
jgi:hypothetical protein